MKSIECKYLSRLKEYRLKAGFTQKQVAEMLGMQCEDRLSHWERGQARPSIQNLLKLVKIYKIRVEELYQGKER